MKLSDVPNWIEEAKRQVMFLPDTESGDVAADLIDHAIERIQASTLDHTLSMQQLVNLQEMIKSTLSNFNRYIIL